MANEAYIYYTGQNQDGLYEFKIVNDFDEPVWYWGYEENHPIYQYSVLSGREWKDVELGWCGTGLNQIELNPDDLFLILIARPDKILPWRLGIRICYSPEDVGELMWSQKIN